LNGGFHCGIAVKGFIVLGSSAFHDQSVMESLMAHHDDLEKVAAK
jgi:hypothetical protein